MCVEDAYNRIGRLCKVPHIHRHLPLQKLVETLDEPRIFSSSNCLAKKEFGTIVAVHAKSKNLAWKFKGWHTHILFRHPFWDSEMGLKFYVNVFKLCKDQTNGLLSLRRKSFLPVVFTSALDQLYGD
ncbi:hypothetical protein DVH24_019902 [Malus domestica]|uniref:Uncharacterized protein n=1 Tax=Malus domestica TaxID=3750 RepID=A0A498I492_MALDO|nr:hypothetical protein DVH24_019902 [Malus domestica]